ncbi:glycoside hydrolase family 9 protein [Parabacteroides sp.]
MRFYKYLFLLICFQTVLTQAQAPWKPDPKLAKQLNDSRYLRHIMKEDSTDAGLTRWYGKKVLKSRELPMAEDFQSLRHTGPGTIQVDHEITISGKGSVRLDTPASLGKKNPTNRNYATPEIIRPLNHEDLREYNRFSVWVYVDAPGVYLTFCGFTLYNEGVKVMPTPGRFEGQHFETVYPNKWQRIVWEIPDLYRDRVTGFSVNIMLAGAPAGASERMSLYVDDMRIEQVEAENTRGFNLRKDAIAYSHSGYKPGARKQALVQHVKDTSFKLYNEETGAIAYEGKGMSRKDGFVLLDFSDLETPGRYTIAIDDIVSKPFAIGPSAYLATAWRTLNFFYSERCGYDQPGIHQECHQDVFCVHPDGRTISAAGGWHDAADLTQGVGNTAEGGIAMLELASAVKGKDTVLYERLLEEARWGLNWTMRTRFGDGYRQGGLIIGIWTKNIRGDKDDMQSEARNTPSDNLIAASYCTLAVPHFEERDPVFARWCRNCAIEDFRFAMELLDTQRTDNNEAELSALATVTAMRLYRLTHDAQYLEQAAQLARTVMACQQLERRKDWSIPLHGFFYESTSKKRILAYYHQSKEHLLMEGLAMLLTDAPNHADAAQWKTACQAYADYLHDIAGKMEPYGLLPSAVYEVNNTDYSHLYHEGDQVGLPSLEEYNAQVRNGIPLGKDFYLRRFPVAYQFRGFHAVTMGKAKAAFILARLLKDEELKHIATRQLEYIVGFNPFAMSTIYGDGYDYPPLYGAYAGNVVGAVPVGIETFENDDEPYFPMQNNCTYKEIWTHTTARVLWLVAELFQL